MNVIQTKQLAIPGVKVIRFGRFLDARGYFTETLRKSDIAKNKELEFKLSETQKSKKTLEEKTKALETEYGVDLEARKNFNLKKPGEEVILFIEE